MYQVNKTLNVVINASTVLISGGLHLTLDMIRRLQTDSAFRLIVTCPKLKPYQFLAKDNTRLKVVPRWMLLRIFRWVHDYFWLPLFIRREKPDMVLTLSNLPSVTKFPQVFLNDNPYVTEKNLNGIPLSLYQLFIQKLRSQLTLSRMKYVNLILVQTEYQKEKMKLVLKQPLEIVVINPSVAYPQKNSLKNRPAKFTNTENNYVLFCPTRYYEHKNLEIFIQVAGLIRQNSLPFKIFLTLSPKESVKAANLLRKIQKNQLENIVINLNHQSYHNTLELIKSADAVILPSLLESFSLTYIEAWNAGKPLLTSDLHSMRSACGNSALYFQPCKPESIIEAIQTIFLNPELRNNLVEKGFQRLSKLTNPESLNLLLKHFAEKSAET